MFCNIVILNDIEEWIVGLPNPLSIEKEIIEGDFLFDVCPWARMIASWISLS